MNGLHMELMKRAATAHFKVGSAGTHSVAPPPFSQHTAGLKKIHTPWLHEADLKYQEPKPLSFAPKVNPYNQSEE